ncbi:hypothetical protein HDU97_002763 [Phlyctochytrium planicorne]|nr:hypothetical protein HDU97_002763 [Phlyctochytrium planicorne]
MWVIVPGFILTTLIGVIFGPAGKQLYRVWIENRDPTKLITDEQLAITVNMLGASMFLLIILHHYLDRQKST